MSQYRRQTPRERHINHILRSLVGYKDILINTNNANTAEELVMGAIDVVIEKITIPEEWLEHVIDELREKHDNHSLYAEKELATNRIEYDRITKRLAGNYENLLDGRITPELHDKYAGEMKLRQEELNDKVIALTKEDKSFLITSSYLLDLAKQVNELFEADDEAQRNELLGYILSNIQLNDKKLTFSVNYPFNIVLEQKENDPDGSEITIWCG